MKGVQKGALKIERNEYKKIKNIKSETGVGINEIGLDYVMKK